MVNRKKKKAKFYDAIVLGIAWYSREQWEKLKEVASDPEKLDDTYEEWKVNAERAIREYSEPDTITRKVHIDVDELMEWCKTLDLPIDGAARSAFAGEKLHEEMEEKE